MNSKLRTLCLGLCLGCSIGTAVLAGLTGCAGDRYNRSTGEYIDDKSVTARVNGALSHNADYRFENVTVAVFKGTVQLSGFVNLHAQKIRAEDLVKPIAGVKAVENRITVKNDSEAGTAESDNDRSMAERVKSALVNNPDYKFEEVAVIASTGTVQLSGFVNTADEKTKAGDLAKEIPGVTDIVNNITVKDKI